MKTRFVGQKLNYITKQSGLCWPAVSVTFRYLNYRAKQNFRWDISGDLHTLCSVCNFFSILQFYTYKAVFCLFSQDYSAYFSMPFVYSLERLRFFSTVTKFHIQLLSSSKCLDYKKNVRGRNSCFLVGLYRIVPNLVGEIVQSREVQGVSASLE